MVKRGKNGNRSGLKYRRSKILGFWGGTVTGRVGQNYGSIRAKESSNEKRR